MSGGGRPAGGRAATAGRRAGDVLAPARAPPRRGAGAARAPSYASPVSFPNGGELLVLLVIVLVVVGPERLPRYSQQLAELVRGGVRYAKGARDSLKEEMGPEFDDIDWQKLDPRQYDPRRIVRDALTDVWDDPPAGRRPSGVPKQLAAPAAGASAAGAAGEARPERHGATRAPAPGSRKGPRSSPVPGRTPYDDEAT